MLTLPKIGKHATGTCRPTHCNNIESIQHVLVDCRACEEERNKLKTAVHKAELSFTVENVLGEKGKITHNHLIRYLKERC